MGVAGQWPSIPYHLQPEHSCRPNLLPSEDTSVYSEHRSKKRLAGCAQLVGWSVGGEGPGIPGTFRDFRQQQMMRELLVAATP